MYTKRVRALRALPRQDCCAISAENESAQAEDNFTAVQPEMLQHSGLPLDCPLLFPLMVHWALRNTAGSVAAPPSVDKAYLHGKLNKELPMYIPAATCVSLMALTIPH